MSETTLNVAELGKKLAVKTEETLAYYKDHDTGTKDENGLPIFKASIDTDKIKAFELELSDLRTQYDGARKAASNYDALSAYHSSMTQEVSRLATPLREAQPSQVKLLGDAFAETMQAKGLKRFGVGQSVDVDGYDTKTLMTTSAGFPPFSQRTGDVVPYANRRIVLTDIIPGSTTDQNAIKYIEETTFTNAAASRAEGAALAESALAYTERTVPIEDVGTWIPVTDRQLEDVGEVAALLNNNLDLMVRLNVEYQALNGDGNTPNLVGILNKSGVLTQAKGADDVFTAIMKAFTKASTGGSSASGSAEASAIVLNPTDWQNIIIVKDAEGRFIYGDPASPNVNRTIWGVNVVQTSAIGAGTALVGDFALYSRFAYRQGVKVEVGWINDDFTKGQKAVRAVTRVALVIRRPAAFCKITGL